VHIHRIAAKPTNATGWHTHLRHGNYRHGNNFFFAEVSRWSEKHRSPAEAHEGTDMAKGSPGNQYTGPVPEENRSIPTLADVGIDKKLSMRATAW
jgi:hypothetical protein